MGAPPRAARTRRSHEYAETPFTGHGPHDVGMYVADLDSWDSHALPSCYLDLLRREILIVTLFVLALRLPFLNQAIQGDDINYIYGAEHAQIDPLHPMHTRYVFLGQMVDMRGHPHPPLNAWYLGLLLAIFRDIREIPFHAAYIVFSLIAAFAALSLARRFCPAPLAATLLFLVTPAFVVNGNSLEADVPFVALWLLSMAVFVAAVDGRSNRLLLASAGAMALTAFAAYQAIILTPILLLYARKWRPGWFAAFAAPATFISWQLFERVSTGALPAGVLAGYMQTYGLQALDHKIRNAVALTNHLAWLVFPGLWVPPFITLPAAIGAAFYDFNPLFWASIAIGAGILIWCGRNWRDFLAQWALIFFAASLILFFSGAARYLLPIALPIAMLAAKRCGRTRLWIGIAAGLALSLGFAVVNYQHWDGYRQFARALRSDIQTKRVWINGEWGLRYYLESEGALPLVAGQPVHPGEMVVSSELCYPIQFTSGGGVLATTAERVIRPAIPLRIVALHGKAGYSSATFGLRPFDISRTAIDTIRAETVIAQKPSLSDLPMNAPEAGQQIVAGVYQLENGQWRWMSQSAVFLLKPPQQPVPLVVVFTIPDSAPARQVTIELNHQRVASHVYTGPGTYTLATGPIRPEGDSVTVTISIDKAFSVPSDRRELGIILSEVGFR